MNAEVLSGCCTVSSPCKVHAQSEPPLSPSPSHHIFASSWGAAVPGSNPRSWKVDFTFDWNANSMQMTCKFPLFFWETLAWPGAGVGCPASGSEWAVEGQGCGGQGRKEKAWTHQPLAENSTAQRSHRVSCTERQRVFPKAQAPCRCLRRRHLSAAPITPPSLFSSLPPSPQLSLSPSQALGPVSANGPRASERDKPEVMSPHGPHLSHPSAPPPPQGQ